MGVNIREFKRPRPKDATVLEHTMVYTGPQFSNPDTVDTRAVEQANQDAFRYERRRRSGSVDEDLKNLNRNFSAGTFDMTKVGFKNPWQETYFNNYGGRAISMTDNYRCPHCGLEWGLAIPPLECPRCHKLTAIGEMDRDGVFKR